jgi:hypothetical protein
MSCGLEAGLDRSPRAKSSSSIRVSWIPVGLQILVAPIQRSHVANLDIEPFYLPIAHNSLLCDALWQRHISMLETPSHQKLCRCTGVLLRGSTTFRCFILRARARGAYASTTMLCFWQKEVMSGRVLKGYTSIWLTAGRSLGLESMSS